MHDLANVLRTVRSASFNDDAAHDLLLELGRRTESRDIAFRILDVAAHMISDSKALEDLYLALERGEILLVPNRQHN